MDTLKHALQTTEIKLMGDRVPVGRELAIPGREHKGNSIMGQKKLGKVRAFL